jgi:hypothetical protein
MAWSKLSPVTQCVLINAVEEASLEGALYDWRYKSSEGIDTARASLTRAILALVDEGLIELRTEPLPSGELLTRDEIAAVTATPEAWTSDEESDDERITAWLLITDAGMAITEAGSDSQAE